MRNTGANSLRMRWTGGASFTWFSATTNQAISVVIFFNVATPDQLRKKFGQRAAAVVAQGKSAGNFTNAGGPHETREVCEEIALGQLR